MLMDLKFACKCTLGWAGLTFKIAQKSLRFVDRKVGQYDFNHSIVMYIIDVYQFIYFCKEIFSVMGDI